MREKEESKKCSLNRNWKLLEVWYIEQSIDTIILDSWIDLGISSIKD